MVRRLATGLVLAALTAGVAGAHVENGDHGRAAVIVEWNQLLQANVPASAGLMIPRFYAMLHVAMFDAVNAVEKEYTNYLGPLDGASGASAEAAAAQAARDLLTALIPAGRAAFDAQLAATLEGIPPGQAAQGVEIGQQSAARVLAWRQNDGWAVPPPPYEPPAIPGLWQRTPPGNLPAGATQFPGVVPFALPTPTLFLPPPPPALNSAKYAEDFEEVKILGSATSPVRTAEQTLRSRLFAGAVTSTNLWAMWNNVARDAAVTLDLSPVDTARLFALVNVSINDALQSTQTSKFVYGLWRPVTAIRRADEDMNGATTPDPTWTPLLTTPNYPAYAGNQSGVAAGAATALRLALDRDDVSFTVLWKGTPATATTPAQPDVSRTFSGFWELAEAQAMSRLHGGIHFDFDNRAGQAVGRKVATYVFTHYMVPREEDRD